MTELFRVGFEPEVYAKVSALSGDDALFGGMRSNQFFGINATNLPFDDENAIREPDLPTATDVPQQPQPITPGGAGSGGVGLGTGGLY